MFFKCVLTNMLYNIIIKENIINEGVYMITCSNCYWMNEDRLNKTGLYWCDEKGKQVSKNGTCYLWKEKKETNCNNDYCELKGLKLWK